MPSEPHPNGRLVRGSILYGWSPRKYRTGRSDCGREVRHSPGNRWSARGVQPGMMVVMPCSAGVARQRERRGGADSPPPGWSPPRSAAPVTASPGTSAAAGRLSWVRRTYYGAGLAITLAQPAPWAPRLAPRGFHYGATLAYLA